MIAMRRLLLLPLLLAAPPVAADDRAPTVRVGNLASKAELARFERRIREACGREARIRVDAIASDKPKGRVVGQYPPRGTRVDCTAVAAGRPIATLYMSAGPAEARLFVPALFQPAQRRAFAQALRQACGAPVSITEIRRPSFLPPGRFVDQSPAQGMRYRCGDPIEVRLSSGPRGETATAERQYRAAPPAERAGPAPQQRAPQQPAPQQPSLPDPAAAAPSPAGLPAQSPAGLPAPAQAGTSPPAAPPAAPPPVLESIDPASIPAAPASAPRFNILGPSLFLLLIAGLLVLTMLWRLGPRPRTAPARPAADRASRPLPSLAPLAPLLALERGWPTATAELLPPARVPAGPPVDALPAVPLLRDLLRPIDPALDWIAATPLAALGGLAGSSGPLPESAEGADTLAPLRADFAAALRFALLFELPPLLARAWAQAPELPFAPQSPSQGPTPLRGWCPLAPHSIEVAVTPDLNLTAAGLPVARPALRLRLICTFPAARLYLRGTALDAFEPGATHVSALLDWAGQTRPLAVLRPHAGWPGQLPVTPPLQLHALPADRIRAAG